MCRNRELLEEIQHQLVLQSKQLFVQNALLREIAKAVLVGPTEKPADTTALTQALQDLESLAPQQEKEKEK